MHKEDALEERIHFTSAHGVAETRQGGVKGHGRARDHHMSKSVKSSHFVPGRDENGTHCTDVLLFFRCFLNTTPPNLLVSTRFQSDKHCKQATL
jgi:hypothetical protein